jgi:hypothetical protein
MSTWEAKLLAQREGGAKVVELGRKLAGSDDGKPDADAARVES